MVIRLDKDYQVKCTLGTIRDIENTFKKSFFKLASELDKLTCGEQIRLLYCGVKRADPDTEERAFVAACEDAMGLGELAEYLEQFVYEIQYPGLTREEAQERLGKKLRQTPAASIGD